MARFINRHPEELNPYWTTAMDTQHHNAGSVVKCEVYFTLIGETIKKYRVQPEHIYNIDEKGFMIGVESKSKRVFDKKS